MMFDLGQCQQSMFQLLVESTQKSSANPCLFFAHSPHSMKIELWEIQLLDQSLENADSNGIQTENIQNIVYFKTVWDFASVFANFFSTHCIVCGYRNSSFEIIF